ncbi:hypothetical protein AVEN_156116-1, partial [Araneus ventricosus]
KLIRVLGIGPPEGRGPLDEGIGEGEESGSESDELVESGCCLMRSSLSVRKDITISLRSSSDKIAKYFSACHLPLILMVLQDSM